MTDHPAFPLPERGSCTGCGACASGCPKGAIHMLPDREGFLYPTVTDACIQCGHCAHICPVRKQREPRPEPAVFAAWNPDAAVRQASTAGGVFSLLAEYILDEGGVVFGAALDEELQVRHIAVKDKAELPRIRGAKPVQSDLGDSFRRVRHYLALPVEGGLRRLDSSLIYYLESEGHRVHFYTEEGDFAAAGTLKAFEEKLAERPFARCNSGYLVNLAQVKSVQQGMVQVGPYELQVSRPRRKAFLAALADHIGGEGA